MLKYFVSISNFNLRNIFSHTHLVHPGQSDLKTFSRFLCFNTLKLPCSILSSNKCQLNPHRCILTERDLLKEIIMIFFPNCGILQDFAQYCNHVAVSQTAKQDLQITICKTWTHHETHHFWTCGTVWVILQWCDDEFWHHMVVTLIQDNPSVLLLY